MNITDVAVLAVVIIIFLCITMFAVEIFIPINKKFEMNNICRSYMYKLERKSTLSNQEISELNNLLVGIGLTDIDISIDSEGKKLGDVIRFEVNGLFYHNSLSELFIRSKERININYERKLTVKKIIN